MADKITRCPKCATAFRISEELLSSAKGVVRCGSCYEVFDAEQNMVKGQTPSRRKNDPAVNEKPQRASRTAAKSKKPVSARKEKSSTEIPSSPKTETVFSSSLPDAHIKKPQNLREPEKLKKPSKESPGLFERKSIQQEEIEEHEVPDDESWALELLKEDESEPAIQLKKVISPKKPKPSAKESTSDDGKPSEQGEKNSSKAENKKDRKSTGKARKVATKRKLKKKAANVTQDSGQPEKLKQEKSSEQESQDPGSPQNQEAVPKEQSGLSEHLYDDQPSSAEDLDKIPKPSIEEQQTPEQKVEEREAEEIDLGNTNNPGPVTLKDTVASIELDPLEVSYQKDRLPFAKRLLWPVSAVVAFVVLAGQIGWLQFHRLNIVEPYRSAYVYICEAFPCKLPELKDRKKIETSNLHIRSHNTIANALLIDVIVKNKANFKQSFPRLRLTFNNLSNKPVATRVFFPEEYLGGEISSNQLMPSNQPVHLSMEIVDPGPQAVGYSITIEN